MRGLYAEWHQQFARIVVCRIGVVEYIWCLLHHQRSLFVQETGIPFASEERSLLQLISSRRHCSPLNIIKNGCHINLWIIYGRQKTVQLNWMLLCPENILQIDHPTIWASPPWLSHLFIVLQTLFNHHSIDVEAVKVWLFKKWKVGGGKTQF